MPTCTRREAPILVQAASRASTCPPSTAFHLIAIAVMSESKSLPLEEISPATQLLEKRRMMYEIQEAFEHAKEEERKREKEFKEKERNLRAKDLVVQEKLITYNQFLQDNEAKRIKANRKYEFEAKEREAKNAKIEELKREIAALQKKSTLQEREVMKSTLYTVRKYEEFLEQVREKYPDEFTDIGDILTRYSTLRNSYTELTERRRKLEEENEGLKRRKDELDKQSKENILELNISISHLQKKQDEAEAERMNLQKNVEQEGYLTSGKQLEMGNMISTIDNIFDRCRNALGKIVHDYKYRGKPEAASADVHEKVEVAKDKLKVIKAYIRDLRAVVQSRPKDARAEATGMKTKTRPLRQNP